MIVWGPNRSAPPTRRPGREGATTRKGSASPGDWQEHLNLASVWHQLRQYTMCGGTTPESGIEDPHVFRDLLRRPWVLPWNPFKYDQLYIDRLHNPALTSS